MREFFSYLTLNVSLFLDFIESLFDLLKSDVPSEMKTRLFQQLLFKFLKCKMIAFLNYCSHIPSMLDSTLRKYCSVCR